MSRKGCGEAEMLEGLLCHAVFKTPTDLTARPRTDFQVQDKDACADLHNVSVCVDGLDASALLLSPGFEDTN